MTDAEQREAARRFINAWHGKGYEKGDTQRFWMSLLGDVLGVQNVAEKIEFEKEVIIDRQTKFIDGYIASTKVLIEQKSLGKDLTKAIPQSGGKMLTPYEQAKNYANNMAFDEAPRWIITCNFSEFYIYDMNKPGADPEIVKLENLQAEIYRLKFVVDENSKNISKEMEISIQAGDIVGVLYDELLKQYRDPSNDESLRSLNALCVRLVFCLYAEDAGIFGRRGMFHDYMKRFEVRDLRRALIELFQVLDTKPEDRDPYMDEELASFPYVNGGLFSDENIEIPQLTENIRELVLQKASEDFDWSQISPTIFGAVFESTLNPETRRAGGMHYTSIENIHKVIDPLFLDELKDELDVIKKIAVAKTRGAKLTAFQDKLANLHWLDPACGSGNFLTESYISVRRLENEVLKAKIEVEKGQIAGQIMFGDLEAINPIKVSIGQFYGIEINDFAVTVAKTALWIAESQMMKETEDVVHMNLNFLPLKSYANIIEANALRIDWNDVIDSDKLDYIMGNPPFVGARWMGKSQKDDMQAVFQGLKNVGNLDYVSAWYWKAAEYIKDTEISVAYVSTNSITQGEQPAIFWKPLMENGIKINFAYRTFIWDSEANIKAHVHCVIVGFSINGWKKPKKLFVDEQMQVVNNINAYLVDAEDIFVESRKKSLCDVPEIGIGNKPIDGGFYLFEKEEMEAFIEKEPKSEKYFRPWYGSREFINQKPRYCLWLGDCPPSELRKMPECLKRIEAVRDYRLSSPSPGTRKIADTPTRFHVENMPKGEFIVIPEVSSERRRYIPIGYMDDTVMCSNKVRLMPNATLFHFGVLESNVHMAWMRAVCCRLKSDYSYSVNVVYNNFPWPDVSEEQKEKIEKTAQAILDARSLYPDSSLADLYDPLTMPPELRKAHIANDKAVMQAYGFNVRETSEASCVATLMELYQKIINE